MWWCVINNVLLSVGVDRCRMCKGHCCALVNDVINTLTEQEELDPDAEVILRVVIVFLVTVLFRTSGRQWLISSIN